MLIGLIGYEKIARRQGALSLHKTYMIDAAGLRSYPSVRLRAHSAVGAQLVDDEAENIVQPQGVVMGLVARKVNIVLAEYAQG